jgi:hypothetical protein
MAEVQHNGLTVETLPAYPGRWVVMGDWYGSRVPVFEADPSHPELIQLADCQSYVRDFEKENA